jgi:hypothetical protein
MKTQLACALVIASAVIGCAQQPKTVWLRTDGRVAANDPVMSRQFEVDSTVCSGDTGKAGLTALNPGSSDRNYNTAVARERGALSNNVMRGCMAEKGYVLVREDEVPAKAAEFAAANAEQARREASLKEPTSSARRVSSAR